MRSPLCPIPSLLCLPLPALSSLLRHNPPSPPAQYLSHGVTLPRGNTPCNAVLLARHSALKIIFGAERRALQFCTHRRALPSHAGCRVAPSPPKRRKAGDGGEWGSTRKQAAPENVPFFRLSPILHPSGRSERDATDRARMVGPRKFFSGVSGVPCCHMWLRHFPTRNMASVAVQLFIHSFRVSISHAREHTNANR